jgi:drug/metabolite transporter (DMT)-like permease
LPTDSRRRLSRAGTLLLPALVILLWGSSFVLTKITLSELGPLNVAFYRWLLAALVFAVLLPARGDVHCLLTVTKRDFARFAMLGLIGISAFYALQNLALGFTTSVNVGLLINVCTVFIALLSVAFLGEQLPALAWVGIGLGLAGATLLSLPSGAQVLPTGHIQGDVLTLMAALCAAIYTVVGKHVLLRFPPVVVTALASAFGTLFLLPFAIMEGLTWPRTPAVWGALLILGIGSGALANLWWWRILQVTPAGRAGVFLLGLPIVSTLIGVVLLREPWPPLAVGGAVCVLVGVYLTLRAG